MNLEQAVQDAERGARLVARELRVQRRLKGGGYTDFTVKEARRLEEDRVERAVAYATWRTGAYESGECWWPY